MSPSLNILINHIIIKSRNIGALKQMDMTLDIYLNYEMAILCWIQNAKNREHGNIMVAFRCIINWCSLAQDQFEKLLHLRFFDKCFTSL
jgi:hypothetical protein